MRCAGRLISLGAGSDCGEHLLNRQDLIDQSRRDRVARHAVIARLGWFLRDDEPAFVLNRVQSEAAIRSGARQDDGDGPLAKRFRHRIEKKIERQPRPTRRRWF